MNLWPLIGGLAGGVGLFLLGMGLMSDGLRLAAGRALEGILARSTETRWRALASGILITALVQSSSAVTVATIGFVNAGLLGLSQALWVLFGANVGTTMTGWLVALVGLNFKIEVLALPLIGLGMLLRLTGEGGRRGAFGTALAGFGVLFLGIDLLRETFAGMSAGLTLPQSEGAIGVLLMVPVGILMTVLMQASAAALVLAFSATQSGMLGLEAGAALVIGANVGTTITAIIASIGATPNARRTAAAHVLFNVLTGVVALLLLPWLVQALDLPRRLFGLDSPPAAKLAFFHTLFNVLGVLLIWPLAGRLTLFLQARFVGHEDDEARPRHLDRTVLAVPALALDALEREVRRLGSMALLALRTVLAVPQDESAVLARYRQASNRLAQAIAEFIIQLNRSGMSVDSAERLPAILRISRYYEAVAELSEEGAAAAGETVAAPFGGSDLIFRAHAGALLAAADPAEPLARPLLERDLVSLEDDYQALKAELLEAGSDGRLPVAGMDARLRAASCLRRACQQAVKAAILLQAPSSPSPTTTL